MPYKNPEDRRARDRENAEKRRTAEKLRYQTDPEYRQAKLERSRARYRADPDRFKEQVRDYRRRNPRMQWAANLRRYDNMTLEEWEAMLIAQSGRCAICLDPMTSPHVDHCHATGRIRGLLCDSCNHGLGKFRDDPIRLAAAIAYLQA